jgi:hypothetical protein
LATLVRSEMGHVKQRKITRKPNTTQRWQNDELEKDSKGNARCLMETPQNDNNPTGTAQFLVEIRKGHLPITRTVHRIHADLQNRQFNRPNPYKLCNE